MSLVAETINYKKLEAFTEKMMSVINSSGLALMISVGHRTGLFDVLAGLKPSTSAEIAEAAGLNERYVREWLGAMVTGRIIDYEPEAREYRFPVEHAAVLTRTADVNLASTTQWLAVLGGVEDAICDCFRNGGGVPYEQFHRFHEVMAEESHQTVVKALETHILKAVPELLDELKRGIDVLDVGCGSGRALVKMATLFPCSRFTGYELCPDAVEAGRAEVARLGLENLRFEARDIAQLGESERFDLITAFDIVHDQARPAEVLKQIRNALRATGTFLMQDIDTSSHLHKNLDNPLAPFLYSISCMHCMTVSLAQDGAGLGTCWGEELAVSMLKEAGFGKTEVKRLPHDTMNAYFIVKKG